MQKAGNDFALAVCGGTPGTTCLSGKRWNSLVRCLELIEQADVVNRLHPAFLDDLLISGHPALHHFFRYFRTAVSHTGGENMEQILEGIQMIGFGSFHSCKDQGKSISFFFTVGKAPVLLAGVTSEER